MNTGYEQRKAVASERVVYTVVAGTKETVNVLFSGALVRYLLGVTERSFGLAKGQRTDGRSVGIFPYYLT